MILSMVDVSTELSTTKATKQGSVNYPMAIMLLEYYNNNMWIDVCCSIYIPGMLLVDNLDSMVL